MKPNLKIVENDPPDTDYKDGDDGGQPPTESQSVNDASYGWRVPTGIIAIVALGVWLASIDTGLLLGMVVLSTLALPWLVSWGWAASIVIWVGLLLAFA